jgi:hypothetical protein
VTLLDIALTHGEQARNGEAVAVSPQALALFDADGDRTGYRGRKRTEPRRASFSVGESLEPDHAQSTSPRESLVFELAEPGTIGHDVHFPEPFGRVHIDDMPARHPIET